jgi:hypothetical protein
MACINDADVEAVKVLCLSEGGLVRVFWKGWSSTTKGQNSDHLQMKVRRIVRQPVRRNPFHSQRNAFFVDEWQFVWIGKELENAGGKHVSLGDRHALRGDDCFVREEITH